MIESESLLRLECGCMGIVLNQNVDDPLKTDMLMFRVCDQDKDDILNVTAVQRKVLMSKLQRSRPLDLAEQGKLVQELVLVVSAGELALQQLQAERRLAGQLDRLRELQRDCNDEGSGMDK